jgi:hypothetical protein
MKKNKDNCICSKTSAHLIKTWKWNIRKWNASRVQPRYLEGARVHTSTHNTNCSSTPRLVSRHEGIRNIPALVRTVLYPASPNLHLMPRRTDTHCWPPVPSSAARNIVSLGRSLSEIWSEYWNGLLLAPVLRSGRELHTYVQRSSGSHFSTRRAQKHEHEKCVQILPLSDQVQLKYSRICAYCKYWLKLFCTATPAIAYKMFNVSPDFSETVHCLKNT